MLYAKAPDLAAAPPDPPPPLGPPTNVGWEYYSGTKIMYTWTNSQSPVNTEYSLDGGDTVAGSFGTGVQSWASGSTTLNTAFEVRHENGGERTVWVGFAA